MACTINIYTSPFEKKLLTRLAKSDICYQTRSFVNSEYIRHLLLEKLGDEMAKEKYTLIVSTNNRRKVGAFGVLDNEPETFYKVKTDVLREGSLLDLICAKNEICQGRGVMAKVQNYLKKRNKQYIFLDSLETNYTYYIKKWGAFSIDGLENMKASILLCQLHNQKGPRAAEEPEAEMKLETYVTSSSMGPTRIPGQFPLVIDVRAPEGIICAQSTKGYKKLLEQRICEGVVRISTRSSVGATRSCREACQDWSKYCHLHM